MRLVVVGTGYVGLVSAATFAKTGCEVIGVDIDAAKIDRLRRGESPIHEPGLSELMAESLADGSLQFSTDLTAALKDAHVVLSAVPTPTGADGATADLAAVFAVVDEVAHHANEDLVFINKSTVPVGTGHACQERINRILAERDSSARIVVVSNPEFLQEGLAVQNSLHPHRIVIGINDGPGKTMALERMVALYRPFIGEGVPVATMDRESAEVVKYASNAFLATKISFINMMSELCEATGADVRAVAAAMGQDPRIGKAFLQAGIGYGGSCFPKDVRALLATGEEHHLDLSLIAAAQEINDHQRTRFFKKILNALPPASTVAVWGLSFKPNTDDIRESPSLSLIPVLLAAGHRVRVFDPIAMANAKKFLPADIVYAESALKAATGCQAVILVTEWAECTSVDLVELKNVMAGNLLFDGRNALNQKAAKAAGLSHTGLGLGSDAPKI